jgi:hypothetical protein
LDVSLAPTTEPACGKHAGFCTSGEELRRHARAEGYWSQATV